VGAGTNQDTVFLIKADDLWLFESTPRAEAFTAPYAESLGVLFRLYNYAGTDPEPAVLVHRHHERHGPRRPDVLILTGADHG
jgi:hypothetical protein